MKKFPARGEQLNKNICWLSFHDSSQRNKRGNNISATGAFLKNNYTTSHALYENHLLNENHLKKHKNGPSSVVHNEFYSQNPNIEMVRNLFQVLFK